MTTLPTLVVFHHQKCPREFTFRKCPIEYAHLKKKRSTRILPPHFFCVIEWMLYRIFISHEKFHKSKNALSKIISTHSGSKAKQKHTQHSPSFLYTLLYRSREVGRKNNLKRYMAGCSQFINVIKGWRVEVVIFFTKIVLMYSEKKIVLVIEIHFWNSRLNAENFQTFWHHLKNLFKQWKVRTNFGNRMPFNLLVEASQI